MHQKFLVCVMAAAISICVKAAEHELSGTWKYAKSADYYTGVRTAPAPEFPLIQFVNGQLFLQPRCAIPIQYAKVEYSYNKLFQIALKDGVDERAMDKFTKRSFGESLSSAKSFYQASKIVSRCNFEHSHVFLLTGKLVLVNGSGEFDIYTRLPASMPMNSEINLSGRKLSELPYNSGTFNVICSAYISQRTGVPATTDSCGPVLYPYVAKKDDADPLAKLIGSHQYKKFGAEADRDYDNPVAHGLHPIYMLFPPMKDVIVVAVEDIEQGESSGRSGMTGVYLTIRGGKVVDQITGECLLQPDYVCSTVTGEKIYQLTENGKFVKVKK